MCKCTPQKYTQIQEQYKTHVNTYTTHDNIPKQTSQGRNTDTETDTDTEIHTPHTHTHTVHMHIQASMFMHTHTHFGTILMGMQPYMCITYKSKSDGHKNMSISVAVYMHTYTNNGQIKTIDHKREVRENISKTRKAKDNVSSAHSDSPGNNVPELQFHDMVLKAPELQHSHFWTKAIKDTHTDTHKKN